MMTEPEEFWAKVNRAGTGCHNWLGGLTSSGYGALAWKRKPAVAHRVAAFLSGLVTSVDAPDDRCSTGFVLHQCDNRRCCNPEHLRVGTLSQNQIEAYQRGGKKPFRGSAHKNAKLSPAQVAEIRRRYPTEVQTKLAAEFGVSQRAISLVVRGETYVE